MKCRECECLHKVILSRWSGAENRFIDKQTYKCFGVKEPFVIDDINMECTEYPERKEKKISIEDAISHYKYGISHDIFIEPVTSYAKMAVEALEKQIPKNVISDGNDSDDWVYCPFCNELLGTNESTYNSFCENNWEPIYCHKCGHKLSWK